MTHRRPADFAALVVTLLCLGQPARADGPGAKGASGPSQSAPGSVRARDVHQAVERSLPFLRAEGIKWNREKQCLACHHVNGIWALNEAHRRGLLPGGPDLAGWNEWSLDYDVTRSVFYQFSEQASASLRRAGLPDASLAALRKFDRTFSTRDDFRRELAKVLGADVLARYEEDIIKAAAKPGQGDSGVGSDSLAATLLLAGTPELTAAPGEARQALADRLVQVQQKDGSWEASLQFHMGQRRPEQESDGVMTLWNLLALASLEAPSDQVVRSRDRARAWLRGREPGVSTESLVTHLLVAHRLGDAERSLRLLKELVGEQHADGGWGWLRGADRSDAFATGLALYGLGVMGRRGLDPEVRRARAYLVGTQRADGTWRVPNTATSKKDTASKDGLYRYWGTSWAVVGLLRILPDRPKSGPAIPGRTT